MFLLREELWYMHELCNTYFVMFEHAQCVALECSGSVRPHVVFCLITVCMPSLHCDSAV